MAGFVKARKGLKPLRLVMGGVSGSGKSYTAMLFATWLMENKTNKPTAAIDTEAGRLSLYSDLFPFDVQEVNPPFDPRFLVDMIKEAEMGGYGQLVIDSSTHYYSGAGGLLEIVNQAAKSKFGGNSHYAWAEGTPIQEALMDTIIRSPIHIIVTSRAKQDYLEQDMGNGRKKYVKQGMGMIQRQGFEYDFDFSMMMDLENTGTIDKGMGIVPPGTYWKKPGEESISQIMDALEKDAVEVERKESLPDVMRTVRLIVDKLGGSKNEELMEILKSYGHAGNFTKIKDLGELVKLKVKLEAFMKKEQE